MRILFITELDIRKTGGLFNATYKRVLKHSKKHDVTVINNNTYHSTFVANIKKLLRKGINYKSEFSTQDIKGVQVRNLNIPLSALFYLKNFLTNSPAEHMFKYYIKCFKDDLEKTDIIHAHKGFPHGYIAYQLNEKYRVPYFVTIHGSELNRVQENNKTKLIKSMENAEKCFFVSEALLREAKSKGYSGENAVVTYNGVDLMEFNREIKITSAKQKKVAYMGAFKEIKGVDLLPEIFREINKLESNISFKLIGDGVLKNNVEMDLIKNELVEKVELLGNIPPEKVPETLEDVGVLVVPSRAEGLGMVVLEANAMGIPVVGSEVGGIPEAIGYNKNVYSLDDNFEKNIAKRVVEILNSSNYESNALKLKERIEENFSWEVVCELEEYHYNKIVKRN
ncbi:glycosyltransferase involved in cell wall biosynthesis [Alkalibacillus filiformis]|uniref:Glycosyltransferase involved in cell wall biosynthesis n=1 Tax=Alkalibacillus filiformis TaxID=200990 RepID=A0ABU0DWC1_9BACI|nr:glycosyltransferase [Alkalibacillus filiformis]MDQ0352759.1 glycosyltransferase involved in cell wall biosynthesis [Alkalibacillus filiformis]